MSCGEPLVINPQSRKNMRDVRLAGFDRDLLKEGEPRWVSSGFRIPNPYFRELGVYQGCGSVSVLDPYSIGYVDPDPDPYSESGSGSRRAKMTHKSRQ